MADESNVGDFSYFAIGDVQGCAAPLERLISLLPTSAQLRFVGDLVNRGPASLRTLHVIRALGSRAQAVLGNHDIHLLAVACGVRKSGKLDTLNDILSEPERDSLIDWLRHLPLVIREEDRLYVHAGVLPSWSADQVMDLAGEVEDQLRGRNWQEFLAGVFGNEGCQWHDGLRGIARHRVVVNALTRLRFCTSDGVMDFHTKEGLDRAPDGLLPWFEVPGRRTRDVTVVCGHWSTLGLLIRDDLIALDTGCVWGGQLTAVGLGSTSGPRKIIQVTCAAAQTPGKSAD